jgi:transposase
VRLIDVPWARPGSGFTLLFEAYVMMLAPQMPIAAAARIVGEHDTRLWGIIMHHVDQARQKEDWSQVKTLGIDETSSKKGHHYISVVVDMDQSKVLYATPGKDAGVVEAFRKDLEDHGGSAAQIEEVCSDMSPAFIKGVGEQFEDASLTFDKFHVAKLIGAAVDEVRRREQKTRPELKASRYAWLFNPENLTEEYEHLLEQLQMPKLNLKTARAYQMRLNFMELYDQDPAFAEDYLKRWYYWATHSRLEPMIKVAKTLKNHWEGVLRWFTSGINNGILEGINSLIQAAKAKARGYRSSEYFITMVYLIAGKLKFDLPT